MSASPMTPDHPRIILASGSRYRAKLLRRLGLPFEISAPEVDETRGNTEPPEQLAIRLAQTKAWAVAERLEDGLIIGSDQVAFLDGTQWLKPGNRENAVRQLCLASGKSLEFLTAICVVNAATQETLSDLNRCNVVFRSLDLPQIQRYVDKEQPFDCAGSFKSEGLGIALFERIEGDDPTALIGLPLIRLVRLLERFGVEVP